MNITFSTYKLASGDGKEWLCHCLENGKSRLLFPGDTEEEAVKAAMDFANTHLDTPERNALLKARAEARVKTREANKRKAATV